MAKSIHTRQYKKFTEILKQVRSEQNLTQGELADRLRIGQSVISKCEIGERRLDIIELKAWCEALGISLSSFAERLDHELRNKSR